MNYNATVFVLDERQVCLGYTTHSRRQSRLLCFCAADGFPRTVLG